LKLLGEGRPVKLSGTEIEFLLPQRLGRIQVDTLKAPKHYAIVEGVLQRLFGRRYGLRVNLEGGTPGADAAPRAAAPSRDLAADPHVKRVLDAFPGSRVDHIE